MEKEQNHSRVVVDTPNSRREYVRTETERVPERRGMSAGTVAAIVVAVGAVVIIFFLLFYNRQLSDQANANAQIAAQTASTQAQQQPQQPIIVQQPAPAQQEPVIVQQPAPAPPQTVIVPAPPSSASSGSPAIDDSSIQEALNKKLGQDEVLTNEAVTAVVLDGEAIISGTVKTDNQKSRAERLAKGTKGVKRVDNQITVSNS